MVKLTLCCAGCLKGNKHTSVGLFENVKSCLICPTTSLTCKETNRCSDEKMGVNQPNRRMVILLLSHVLNIVLDISDWLEISKRGKRQLPPEYEWSHFDYSHICTNNSIFKMHVLDILYAPEVKAMKWIEYGHLNLFSEWFIGWCEAPSWKLKGHLIFSCKDIWDKINGDSGKKFMMWFIV